jgi:hypothetical protein
MVNTPDNIIHSDLFSVEKSWMLLKMAHSKEALLSGKDMEVKINHSLSFKNQQTGSLNVSKEIFI